MCSTGSMASSAWPGVALNATFLGLCQHCRGCCMGNKGAAAEGLTHWKTKPRVTALWASDLFFLAVLSESLKRPLACMSRLSPPTAQAGAVLLSADAFSRCAPSFPWLCSHATRLPTKSSSNSGHQACEMTKSAVAAQGLGLLSKAGIPIGTNVPSELPDCPSCSSV